MSELRMKYKHDTGIDPRSYEIKVSTDYDIESDSFIPTIVDTPQLCQAQHENNRHPCWKCKLDNSLPGLRVRVDRF